MDGMLRALVLVLALVLVAAVPADAAQRLPWGTYKSLEIAGDFWGLTPRCGAPRVYLARLGDTYALADRGACSIFVDVYALEDNPAWYCSYVLHEFGHLLGRRHSKRDASIMHTPIRRLAEPCARRFLTPDQYNYFRQRGWANAG